MYTAIPNRYLIGANFQKRAIDFSFPAEVWGVAAALSEHGKAASTFELETLTGLGSDQIREAVERLLAEDLVREDVMSWKEFTAVKKREGGNLKVAARGAKPAPNTAQVQAQRTSEPNAPADSPPAQNGVALRLGSITPMKTTSASGSAWITQKPDPAQVASFRSSIQAESPGGEQVNGRLLRPILEQIERVKGGGVEGQLLVYQVFLRVPYDLLCAEGIKSLHFVDDHTRIRNPKLLAAIVKAAKDVIGIELA